VGELVALCEESTYDGLINPDAPCFAAPASMTTAIREYCLAAGQPAPETPADYCRCIFRSLANRYREIVDILQSMCDFQIKKLHVIGGGSQNKYLMQYAANALNMPVICGPVEGTALGNVLMQMKASGAVDTLEQMRAISAASVELVTYTPEN
jgi:rhamnulokinase